MGKKAIRAKKCEGKTRWISQDGAARGIEILRARTGTTDMLTPYRCGFCQFWHFGHPPGRVLKRLRNQLLKKAA